MHRIKKYGCIALIVFTCISMRAASGSANFNFAVQQAARTRLLGSPMVWTIGSCVVLGALAQGVRWYVSGIRTQCNMHLQALQEGFKQQYAACQARIDNLRDRFAHMIQASRKKLRALRQSRTSWKHKAIGWHIAAQQAQERLQDACQQLDYRAQQEMQEERARRQTEKEVAAMRKEMRELEHEKEQARVNSGRLQQCLTSEKARQAQLATSLRTAHQREARLSARGSASTWALITAAARSLF